MTHRYRKLPVEIEAAHFKGTDEENNGVVIADWCGGTYLHVEDDNVPIPRRFHSFIVIPTLEGSIQASLGDYVICGVKGEFYPCKPDIFEQTYELVE